MRQFLREYWAWIIGPPLVLVAILAVLLLLSGSAGSEGGGGFLYNIW